MGAAGAGPAARSGRLATREAEGPAAAGTRGETCCGRRPARPGLAARSPLCSHREPHCRRPRLCSETNPGPARRSRRAPPAAHPREGPARLPPGTGRLLPPAALVGVPGPDRPRGQPPRPVRRGVSPAGAGARAGTQGGGHGNTRCVRVPAGHRPAQPSGPRPRAGARSTGPSPGEPPWIGSGEEATGHGQAPTREPPPPTPSLICGSLPSLPPEPGGPTDNPLSALRPRSQFGIPAQGPL